MTRYNKALLLVFILTIIWSAIRPLSDNNWILEILPVFITMPFIYYLGKRYTISSLSWTFMFLYFSMPVVQAHYGVGFVPIGVKLAPLFDTTRNVFDRFTHFFFGFFLFFPIFEMIRQSIGKRKFLNYMIPAASLLGLAAVYEISEWLVFVFSGPRLSFLFIGAQDDFYDTPKDMFMTFVGVILAMVSVGVTRFASELKKVSVKQSI